MRKVLLLLYVFSARLFCLNRETFNEIYSRTIKCGGCWAHNCISSFVTFNGIISNDNDLFLEVYIIVSTAGLNFVPPSAWLVYAVLRVPYASNLPLPSHVRLFHNKLINAWKVIKVCFENALLFSQYSSLECVVRVLWHDNVQEQSNFYITTIFDHAESEEYTSRSWFYLSLTINNMRPCLNLKLHLLYSLVYAP